MSAKSFADMSVASFSYGPEVQPNWLVRRRNTAIIVVLAINQAAGHKEWKALPVFVSGERNAKGEEVS